MEELKKSFDVIVVGAGTSGSIAARFAAQLGLSVCLIDSNEKNQIGNKTCGDGIVASIFDFLKIDPPKGEDFMRFNSIIRFYTSDEKHYLAINLPGYLVDRIKFGQRLLNESIEAGIDQFLDKTKGIELIYDNNNVSGVKVRLKSGEKVDLKSKITIDASGCFSSLRRKIKSDVITSKISNWDLALCYREIIKFTKGEKPTMPSDYITVVVDPDNVPGGYIWYFPKSETIVNIGLGAFMHYKGQIKDFYKKYAFNRFIKTRNIEILSSAGGVIPFRKPLLSCADNGIMIIGDAACHVNTTNGGGIHTGMKAGYYAANVAKIAVDKGDYSLNTLWDYNYKIMTDFGAVHAAADFGRLLMQYSSSDVMDFIIKKQLLNNEDLTNLWSDEMLKLTLKTMIKKLSRGISRPKLLLQLSTILRYMNKIYKLYKNYPKSFDLFEKWKEKENRIYNKLYSKYVN